MNSTLDPLRGPSSALYGGGAAGGVISVTTADGGANPIAGTGDVSIGSFGFWKGFAEGGGAHNALNYRMSLSHTAGDGYRVHSAFEATNFYSKLRFTPSDARVADQHIGQSGIGVYALDRLAGAGSTACRTI